MKTITITVLSILVVGVTVYAQDSTKVKNIKEETITRVIVTKAVNVETKVTETVLTEEQIIKIEDTGIENQNEVFSSKRGESVNVIASDVDQNKKNDSLIEEIKKAQLREIEASKIEQRKKYEAEKKLLNERKEVIEMKRLEELKKNGYKKKDN